MSQLSAVFLVIIIASAIIAIVLALAQVSRGRFGALNYKTYCPAAAGKVFKNLLYVLVALIVAEGLVLWHTWDMLVL